jgi:hypothetical protein
MTRTLILIVTAVQLIWTGHALAEDADSQAACAAMAFKRYLAANQAFNNNRVQDQIAQRRLQEQFCLRFVQCIAHDQGQDADVAAASHFAGCLKEEAIELYKLYQD